MASLWCNRKGGSRGFSMSFDNGVGLSVIWGYGSYSSNYEYWGENDDVPDTSWSAEVMLLVNGKACFEPKGWVEPERVANLLAMLANAPDKDAAIKVWKDATGQEEVEE